MDITRNMWKYYHHSVGQYQLFVRFFEERLLYILKINNSFKVCVFKLDVLHSNYGTHIVIVQRYYLLTTDIYHLGHIPGEKIRSLLPYHGYISRPPVHLLKPPRKQLHLLRPLFLIDLHVCHHEICLIKLRSKSLT